MLEEVSSAPVAWRTLLRAPARVSSPNRLLGPFSTPAAVLRWRAQGPLDLWCASSGWFGPDLGLELADGTEVIVPLNRLRMDAPRGAWSSGIDLPHPLPQWLWKAARRGAASWWELPMLNGMELELDAVVPAPRATTYRTLPSDSRPLVAREGTVHLALRRG